MERTARWLNGSSVLSHLAVTALVPATHNDRDLKVLIVTCSGVPLSYLFALATGWLLSEVPLGLVRASGWVLAQSPKVLRWIHLSLNRWQAVGLLVGGYSAEVAKHAWALVKRAVTGHRECLRSTTQETEGTIAMGDGGMATGSKSKRTRR
eukprot:4027679-Amphidinium_carterae.1